MELNNQKLIVITGPTASGKTSLAVKLAKKFGGEIISADSRAIYRGIDIAAAKPTMKERDGVPHWGFDLVDPDDEFTVADFKDYACRRIKDIVSRGKLPFVVGGTGLYVDAILYDYEFGKKQDKKLRQQLNKLSVEELQKYCTDNNISMPENSKNKRYLIRAIENKDIVHSKKRSIKNNNISTIVVGISTERDVLRSRIMTRSEQFFESGVINEAKQLATKYGWNSEAMKSNAYPLIKDYLDGETNYTQLVEKNAIKDWHLAKRQLTFMKRNKDIVWLSLVDAEKYISEQLS